MRIAVISDLHLGANQSACHFGHEEGAFLRFLDFLENTHDRIVLLGDIFQAHHGVGLSARHQRKQVVRIRDRFRDLVGRFQSLRYELVHGNHDEILARIEGCPSSAQFRADGFGVYCVHGHQFDPILQEFGPMARFSTWLAGRARMIGLGLLDRTFHWLDGAFQQKSLRVPEGPYARGAERILKEGGFQVVVMGHTHVGAVHRIGKGWLANSGTCAGGRFSWVSIDTKERSVRLEGTGVPHGDRGSDPEKVMKAGHHDVHAPADGYIVMPQSATWGGQP